MAQWSVKSAVAIAEDAWRKKGEFNTLLSEAYEHALPGLNPYFANGTGLPQSSGGSADKTSKRVVDSTLQNDAAKLANRIQYELFPIGHQWAAFTAGPFVAADAVQQALADLKNLQEVIFLAIQFSNFDLSIAEWLLELVVAGTACMLIQDGDENTPLVYQTVCQAHVAFREGAFGKIDMISRKMKIRHSLIVQTWRDAKSALLAELKPDQAAGKPEADDEIDLLDVCYWDHDAAKWRYEVIAITAGAAGAGQKETRLVERVYDYNPWIISRWSKAAGEAQGRSLVMASLPDARVLSSVKTYLLKHAALAIGGVFLVRSDGTVNANNLRIFPGATIPVRATGGPAGASIAPLQVQGDINLAQLVIQDLQQSIHMNMLANALPEIKDGVRSATEFVQRMKELQQSLGAPFSRILKEGIIPMLETTIAILGKAGVIPLAEGQKIKLNSGEIQVRFASPLVQGQSIREVEALQQAAAITREIAGDPQAVALAFKVEDIGAWVSQKLGVHPPLMRSAAERVQLQKQAGQLMAIQQGGGMAPGVGGGGGVRPPAPANQQQAAMGLAA